MFRTNIRVIWKGTIKATYYFPNCNIFFIFSWMDWYKLRKNLRIFCHMCALSSACTYLLRYWTLCRFIPHPLYFSFFFAFITLSSFVLSFLFISLHPFNLSVCHPLPLLFSLSFTLKQSTDIPPETILRKKNSVYVYFISAKFPSGLLRSVRAIKQKS